MLCLHATNTENAILSEKRKAKIENTTITSLKNIDTESIVVWI